MRESRGKRTLRGVLLLLVVLLAVTIAQAGSEEYTLDESLADEALAAAAAKEMSKFYKPIIANGDIVEVHRSQYKCYIMAKDSEDINKWAAGMSFVKGSIAGFKCRIGNRVGLPEHGCLSWKRIGLGLREFVESFNEMRFEVLRRMQRKCDLARDDVIVVGHSRGGAIAQIIAAALYLDEIVPASQLTLITFGSPRALETSLSDLVHDKFKQIRLINGADTVPSMPPWWLRFEHFGTVYCRECGYPPERDAPKMAYNVYEMTEHYLASYQAWLTSKILEEVHKAERFALQL
mmetsp:Transcript_16764/g.32641  ORF Transcript_16764/g.32641 Transcript_16764/m.32641 type:complete len:291 (-) Transcript_16764:222-1094(-)